MMSSRTGSIGSRWLEFVLVAALWLLVAAAALVFRALDPDHPFSWHTIAVTAVEFVPWMLLTPVIFWLARRFPFDRSAWLRSLPVHLSAAVVLTFTVRAVQQIAFERIGPPPEFHRRARMGRLEFPPPPRQQIEPPPERPPGGLPDGPPNGPPGPQLLPLQIVIYLMVLGAGFARSYGIELRDRRQEAAQLASQLGQARLQALRMQLNPHFLFNALNAVSALADDDPAAVRRIVSRLSALLRRVLDSESTPEVTLREELDSVRDYMEIQSIRFGDALEFSVDVHPDAMAVRVPAFILQPLVENAVEHAAARRTEGVATIDVAARLRSGRLVVEVSDNGSGGGDVPNVTAGGGVGLRNIRERLTAHYGSAASLALTGSARSGTQAVVTLPAE